MANSEDEDKIHLPQGSLDSSDLSTGGQGSGNSDTDSGGLDVSGNELGAADPGSDTGRSEGTREEQADEGARQV